MKKVKGVNTIAVASDHAGVEFKKLLKKLLEDAGYIVEDFGCDSKKSCDYPNYGIPAVRSVARGENNKAILICGNGIGMSILANKIKDIRAALVYDDLSAQETSEHHDSNVLCLGARHFTVDQLLGFVEIWLSSQFEEGGRHDRRTKKVRRLDSKNKTI